MSIATYLTIIYGPKLSLDLLLLQPPECTVTPPAPPLPFSLQKIWASLNWEFCRILPLSQSTLETSSPCLSYTLLLRGVTVCSNPLLWVPSAQSGLVLGRLGHGLDALGRLHRRHDPSFLVMCSMALRGGHSEKQELLATYS